jgi:hypothetical protein
MHKSLQFDHNVLSILYRLAALLYHTGKCRHTCPGTGKQINGSKSILPYQPLMGISSDFVVPLMAFPRVQKSDEFV